MDSSGGPAAIPRLRIPRSGSTSMQDPANSSLSTQAGPSRLPDSRILDEDDLGGITPRAPMSMNMPLSGSYGREEELQDTPAYRLRALLARVPTDKNQPAAVPSSPESELDAPDFGSSTMQSYAKESLASLFSRARREPGDTPLKETRGRTRRNSVDASDLDSGSPRVHKVRQETKKYKGKRKSISDDEETDFSPRKSLNSQSQALTFDILRERLGQSQSQLRDEHLSQDDILETSTATDHHSEGEESTSFLHDLDFDKSQASPPAATSTPMQSLHMSADVSQLRNQSNLLDNDSEMREAMMVSDSFENSKEANLKSSIAEKTPGPSNGRRRHSAAGNPNEASQEMKTLRGKSINSTSFPSPGHSVDDSKRSPNVRPPTSILAGLQRRLSTMSLSGTDDDLSRPSSRASSRAESRERSAELEKQRNAEREHAWNRPNVSKLGRFHSDRDVSSTSSHAKSPSQSQSLSARQRTYSQPSRFSLPASPGFQRPLSRASMSSASSSRASSRANSPALSMRSDRSDMSIDEEEVQLRERNWNSPIPNWTPPSERQRSLSITRIRSPMPFPLPAPASPSPSPGPRRRRTDSLKSSGSSRASSPALSVGSNGSSMLIEDDDDLMSKSMSLDKEKSWSSPRPKWKSSMSSPSPSPSASRLRTQSIPSTPSRSPSSRLAAAVSASPRPSISPRANTQPSSSRSPAFTQLLSSRSPAGSSPSRSLIQPSNLSARPESPLATKATRIPSTPSSTRSARLSSPQSTRPSHIPVRSSRPSITTTPARAIPSISFPEEESESDGTDTEPDEDQANYQSEATPTLRTVPDLPVVVTPPLPATSLAPPSPLSQVSSPSEATPTLRAAPSLPVVVTPPLPTTSLAPPAPPSHSSSSPATSPTTPRASEASKPLPDSPPDSPPPSSPSEGPTTPQEEINEPKFTLPETPPRKASMSSVLRFEDFQTPSPPKGLPELPGPPSSDDEDTGPLPLLTPLVGNNTTMMKTPRPPGAWADTPAPAKTLRQNMFARSVSFAEESSAEAIGPSTPVGSLSRAGSAPVPPTPAVPGGWLATPATNKNSKSVRFESMSESEQSMSEMDITDVQEVKAEAEVEVEETETEVETEVKQEEIVRPRTPEPPRTPPRSPKSPRKSPAVRVVDEFGRQLDLFGEEEKKVQPNGALTTPRSRSGVRIVDAMGREVEESDSTVSVHSADHDEEPDDEFVMPSTLHTTLRRIDKVTGDLKKGILVEHESGIQHRTGKSKIPEMSASQRALARKYQDPKTGETVAANARIGRQRNAAISKMVTLLSRREGAPSRAYWWGIMAIQLLVLLIVYRIWGMRSRDAFLTTYYDPFYGEVYLYPSKPEPPNLQAHGHWWSLLSRTWREDGLLSLVARFFDLMLLLVRKSIWDMWGPAEATPRGAVSWPPT